MLSDVSKTVQATGDVGAAGIAKIFGDERAEKKFVSEANKKLEDVKPLETIGLGERTKSVQEISRRVATGEQSPVGAIVAAAGQGVAGVGDFVGDVVAGAIGTVTPNIVKDAVLGGLGAAGEAFLKTSTGKDFVNAVKGGVDAYRGWKEKNPAKASELEGVANIASVLPIEKVVGIGLKTASKALDVAKTPVEKSIVKTVSGLKTGKEASKDVVAATKTGLSDTAVYGTSQVTGFNPNTVRAVLSDPDSYSPEKIASFSRDSVADNVYRVFQDKKDEVSNISPKYKAIRDVPGQTFTVPKDDLKKVLEKDYGLKVIDEKGAYKLQKTKETRPIKDADISALEDVFNTYFDEDSISNNAFLNARKVLDELSEWDYFQKQSGKTEVGADIARKLRSTWDEKGKATIKGLKEADEEIAPLLKELSTLKSEYFTPDGKLKDSAINTIANLGGKGKREKLKRLEKIVPGIGKEIEKIAVFEDIVNAGGQKVGTYVKAAAVGFLAGGPVGFLIGMYFTDPSRTVAILRFLAKKKGIATENIQKLSKSLSRLRKDENAIIEAGELETLNKIVED